MEYVCKVVGNLNLEEINLSLTYMEIVDLSQDDFKSSPRLRDALRKKEIEVYNARLHPSARKIKNYVSPNRQNQAPVHSFQKDYLSISEIKSALATLSFKIDSVVGRMDEILRKNQTESIEIPQTEHFSGLDVKKIDETLNKILDAGNKVDAVLSKQDAILEKLEEVMARPIALNNYNPNSIKTTSSSIIPEDVPIFIPKMEQNVGDKNIQAQEIQSEGTEDILEKLRKMKQV